MNCRVCGNAVNYVDRICNLCGNDLEAQRREMADASYTSPPPGAFTVPQQKRAPSLAQEREEAINRILYEGDGASVKDRLDERRKKRQAEKTATHSGFPSLFSQERRETPSYPARGHESYPPPKAPEAPKRMPPEPEPEREEKPRRTFSNEFVFTNKQQPEPEEPPAPVVPGQQAFEIPQAVEPEPFRYTAPVEGPNPDIVPPDDSYFALTPSDDEQAKFNVDKKNEEFQELLDKEFERLKRNEDDGGESRNRFSADAGYPAAPDIPVKSSIQDRIDDYLRQSELDAVQKARRGDEAPPVAPIGFDVSRGSGLYPGYDTASAPGAYPGFDAPEPEPYSGYGTGRTPEPYPGYDAAPTPAPEPAAAPEPYPGYGIGRTPEPYPGYDAAPTPAPEPAAAPEPYPGYGTTRTPEPTSASEPYPGYGTARAPEPTPASDPYPGYGTARAPEPYPGYDKAPAPDPYTGYDIATEAFPFSTSDSIQELFRTGEQETAQPDPNRFDFSGQQQPAPVAPPAPPPEAPRPNVTPWGHSRNEAPTRESIAEFMDRPIDFPFDTKPGSGSPARPPAEPYTPVFDFEPIEPVLKEPLVPEPATTPVAAKPAPGELPIEAIGANSGRVGLSLPGATEYAPPVGPGPTRPPAPEPAPYIAQPGPIAGPAETTYPTAAPDDPTASIAIPLPTSLPPYQAGAQGAPQAAFAQEKAAQTRPHERVVAAEPDSRVLEKAPVFNIPSLAVVEPAADEDQDGPPMFYKEYTQNFPKPTPEEIEAAKAEIEEQHAKNNENLPGFLTAYEKEQLGRAADPDTEEFDNKDQKGLPPDTDQPWPAKKTKKSDTKKTVLSVIITVLIIVLVIVVACIIVRELMPDSIGAFYIDDFVKTVREALGIGKS